MILAVDIETYEKTQDGFKPVLDTTKFILGVITNEKLNSKPFYNKQDLWNYITQKGINEAKRDKVLNIYAHNHIYDFYGYANLNDKHIRIKNHQPFITSYTLTYQQCKEHGIKPPKLLKKGTTTICYNNKPDAIRHANTLNAYVIKLSNKYYLYHTKDIIKFLDTYSIYKTSLKHVGYMIGQQKTDLPLKLLNGTKKEIQKKLLPYCINDTEIVMKSIHTIKQLLKQNNIQLKRLYTMPQISIGYLINKLKKQDIQGFWYMKERGWINRPKNPEHIHQGFRGGRVQAFQTGIIHNVNYIDINSLYGWCIKEMNFPDLQTENLIQKPLEICYHKNLLKKIGISRAMLQNKKDGIGLLQIRTPTGNYIPTKNQYMIGTWTHDELQLALQNGYELLDIEWSIIYQQTQNPLKNIIEQCYQNRLKGNLESYFYKSIMNLGIGKFSQNKGEQEIIIDCIEKHKEYLERNYKMIKGIEGTTNIIYKKNTKGKLKPYYNPIISALTTSKARNHMYKQLNKIPQHDLVYTDTDSILFTGNHLKKYDIGKGLGQFKIVTQNQTAVVYGKKTYAINRDIKISGTRGRGLTVNDFKKGKVKNTRMNTLHSAIKGQQIGTFSTITRDLKEQLKKHEEIQEDLQAKPILMDYGINNINHFRDILYSIDY